MKNNNHPLTKPKGWTFGSRVFRYGRDDAVLHSNAHPNGKLDVTDIRQSLETAAFIADCLVAKCMRGQLIHRNPEYVEE